MNEVASHRAEVIASPDFAVYHFGMSVTRQTRYRTTFVQIVCAVVDVRLVVKVRSGHVRLSNCPVWSGPVVVMMDSRLVRNSRLRSLQSPIFRSGLVDEHP